MTNNADKLSAIIRSYGVSRRNAATLRVAWFIVHGTTDGCPVGSKNILSGPRTIRTDGGDIVARKLHSYGRHFTILDRQDLNGSVYTLNTSRYSPTTSRHISAARQALIATGYVLVNTDTDGTETWVIAGEAAAYRDTMWSPVVPL